jgi:hypothetical protein
MNWNVHLLYTIARTLHILHLVYIYISFTSSPEPSYSTSRLHLHLLYTIARTLQIPHLVCIYISFTPSPEPFRFYISFAFTAPLHHRQNPSDSTSRLHLQLIYTIAGTLQILHLVCIYISFTSSPEPSYSTSRLHLHILYIIARTFKFYISFAFTYPLHHRQNPHILHLVYIYISFTQSSEPLRFYASCTFNNIKILPRDGTWEFLTVATAFSGA